MNVPAFERRTKIVDAVRAAQRLSTRQLSDMFDVSEVTIRQDLARLEDEGLIERIHGGAAVTSRLQAEETHAERASRNLLEKQRIGKAAAALVRDGETILLDSSTTAFQMTPYLAEMRGLRVITNQFHVARVLSAVPSIQVILLGGALRAETWSMVGPLAEDMLSRLHAGTGFFGAAGVSLERGFTDADPREVYIKRAMTEIVDSVIVLIDSNKFGRQALMQAIPLERASRVITTTDAPRDGVAGLLARGITVETV
jgi:DeoR/GlpR family transcriptional regulator of sugar metabolism